MKPRTLLILTAVVLALGAFIWFYERDLPGSRERQEMADKLLGGLEAPEVTHLTITLDDQKVRLERLRPPEEDEGVGDGESEAGDDGAPIVTPSVRWRLLEPYDAKADARTLDTLLRDLVRLEKKRTLDDPDRSELGLEPPRVTVTLETEEGQRVVEVGDELPVSGGRVVSLAGEDDVHVVEGDFFAAVTRKPGDWRSREVFDAENRDIVRVRFVPPEGERTVTLARQGERRFRLETPVEDYADRDEANRLILTMTDLAIQQFLDEASPDELGLEEPSSWIEAEIRGRDETVRLELGSVADAELGRYHARLGEQIVTLDVQNLLDLLGRSPGEWRSPRLTELQIFQVDAVEVEQAGAEPFAVERDEPNWRRDGEPVLYAPVRKLLLAATSTKADRVVPVTEAAGEGLLAGEPTLTLTLVAEEEDETATEELTVYPAVDGELPVTTDRREVVLLLTGENVSSLTEGVEGVRNAPLAEEDEPAEIDVEVEEGDGEVPESTDG